jgi:hypothetical protein
MFSNIHRTPPVPVDATYYIRVHSTLDEAPTKKTQAPNDKMYPGLRVRVSARRVPDETTAIL